MIVDAHPEPGTEALDRVLEVGIVEGRKVAAHLAHHVVVVVASGIGGLVAGLGAANLEPLDQSVLHQHVQSAIDARPPDRAALGAQGSLDVVRAEGARLACEQVDDLGAGAAAPVAGLFKHPLGVCAPAGVMDRHACSVAGTLATPRATALAVWVFCSG